MLVFLTGITAGGLHVVAGPDHIAALAPLAAEEPDTVKLGATWGVGHGVGVLVIAVLAWLAHRVVDVHLVSLGSELFVGVMLVGLGIAAFQPTDSHSHHGRTALGVGLLHGMAGGSHVVGVLPALGLSAWQAGVYLVAYLAGAIATMATVGGLLGLASRRDPAWARHLRHLAGVVAIVVGLVWLVTGLAG
jgi:hypothetical protein